MTPQEMLKHWHIVGRIRPVRVGIFNRTYRVKTASGNFILQKLHPLISHDAPTQNYAAITNFLRRHHYPAQEIIYTPKKNMILKDGKQSWRLLREIPGVVYTRIHGAETARELGKALGRVHKILKGFEGPLRKTLPMFRYAGHLKKLRNYKVKLEKDRNPEVRKAAETLLKDFPRYFLPADLPKRVVHTDPKVSNFVFRKSPKEVVMIDFDTVQRLSPLYDIGDALRSVCGGEEDDRRNNFDMKRCRAFLRGYFSSSGNYLGPRERKLIHRATDLVILGLAVRFLNDYVDDFYFGWDKKRYDSRKAHNLARALGQIALYEDFSKKYKVGGCMPRDSMQK